MGKLNFTVSCPDDDTETIYHIPDDPGSDTTLCGLSDVLYKEHNMDDHPVNCSACIKIVKYCRNLRFKKA